MRPPPRGLRYFVRLRAWRPSRSEGCGPQRLSQRSGSDIATRRDRARLSKVEVLKWDAREKNTETRFEEIRAVVDYFAKFRCSVRLLYWTVSGGEEGSTYVVDFAPAASRIEDPWLRNRCKIRCGRCRMTIRNNVRDQTKSLGIDQSGSRYETKGGVCALRDAVQERCGVRERVRVKHPDKLS